MRLVMPSGNPTGFHLTEHDLEALMNQLNAVLADKAYDADERMRKKLAAKGCQAVITPKKNRLDPIIPL